MNLSEFEIKVVVGLLVSTWAVVVPGLMAALWWFVKKDRSAFFTKLREHDAQLTEYGLEIVDLNNAVFGHDRVSGINKWEHRARSLLQPTESRLQELSGTVRKLTLAIARAVPTIDLQDLA